MEQLWSIDRYFEFVLLLMFSTGLAFQIPVIQLLLGLLGVVNSQIMLKGWRYVLLGAAVLGAVLTPSTDPITQSLSGWCSAVPLLWRYFYGQSHWSLSCPQFPSQRFIGAMLSNCQGNESPHGQIFDHIS